MSSLKRMCFMCETVPYMKGKVAKRKTGGKKGEKKEMVGLKRRTERSIKQVKDKMKRDFKRERAMYREKLRNMKRRLLGRIDDERRDNEHKIKELQEIYTNDIVGLRHQLYSQDQRIINMGVGWNTAVQHEIRRRRQQTERIRRLEVALCIIGLQFLH